MSETIQQYLKRIGREGGKARAAKHSKEQLSEWGRLGGRPRKPQPVRPTVKAASGDSEQDERRQ